MEFCNEQNLKHFFMFRVHYTDIPTLHKIAHYCYGTPELVKVMVNHAWYYLLSRKADPNGAINQQLNHATKLVKTLLGEDYKLHHFHPSTSPRSSNSSHSSLESFNRFLENLSETVPIVPSGFAANAPRSEAQRLIEYHPTQPRLDPNQPPYPPSSDTEMDLEETRSEASLLTLPSFFSTLHSHLPLNRSNTSISPPLPLRPQLPRTTQTRSLRLRLSRLHLPRSLLLPLVGLLPLFLLLSLVLTAWLVKNVSSNELASPNASMSVFTFPHFQSHPHFTDES